MIARLFALSFFAALVAAIFVAAAAPSAAREVVGFGGYPRGTIVVKTSERRLYFVNSDGNPGYFKQQYWVYQRNGQPCRKCGAIIMQIRQGQRSSFYCPHCQK